MYPETHRAIMGPQALSEPRPSRRQVKRHPLLWPKVFMALYGAGWSISFDLGVRLYGAEIVTFIGLALIGWGWALKKYRALRKILFIYLFWAIAIVISDLVNETAIFDSLRNLATLIIGAGGIVFVLTALSKQPSALLFFLGAMAITKGILGEPLYGDAFSNLSLSLESLQNHTNFFKVRIDPFLTPAFLLIACLIGRKSLALAAAIFIAASLVYFSLDARSSGLTFFLSGSILVMINYGFRPRPGQIAAAGVALAMVGYGAYLAYAHYTLTQNPYSQSGRQLQFVQNPYNPFDLLRIGRSEWVVMPTAISERPLFGWGSWAVDKDRKFAYLRAERIGGYNGAELTNQQGQIYIPAHSLIGSAWLWSGLLGFIAAAALLRIIFALSLQALLVRSIILPAAVFLTIQLFWHFFFSPPQVVRLFFPVAIATLVVLTANIAHKKRRNLANSAPTID